MKCTIISNGKESSINCNNETAKPYCFIKRQLCEIIWSLYCKGYDTFYVNCEYGIPLWSAEIINALKTYNNIKLYIVMPYEEQFFNWQIEYYERFFETHRLSDAVFTIGRNYTDKCYEKAEEVMIDNSDLVVVFGNPSDKLHACKYADIYHKKIRFYSVNLTSYDIL